MIATADALARLITGVIAEEGKATRTPIPRAERTGTESVRIVILDVSAELNVEVTAEANGELIEELIEELTGELSEELNAELNVEANVNGTVIDVAMPAETTRDHRDATETRTRTVGAEAGSGAMMAFRDKKLVGAHPRRRRSGSPPPTSQT